MGARTMLVSPHNRAVDHHVFIGSIGGQMTENPFNHAAFAPAAQSSVNILPVPEPHWQVTPRNAGASAHLSEKQEENITDQMEVQALWHRAPTDDTSHIKIICYGTAMKRAVMLLLL